MARVLHSASAMAPSGHAARPHGGIEDPFDRTHGPLPRSLSELLEPDTILPEQFFDGPRRDSYLSGERALMLAVLEDGIRCFQEHLRNPRLKPRLLARQAEEWIRSEDWDWPFSFNNVCEHLGLNPSAVRSTLLRQKFRRRASSGPAVSSGAAPAAADGPERA